MNQASQRLKREDRRQSILQGAARAFVAHGYQSTSLDDIALETGVSRVILYRHFTSKKELYLAILENFRERLPALNSETDFHTIDDTDRITSLINAATTDPDGFRLVFRHALYEPDFQKMFEDIQTHRMQFIDERLKAQIPAKNQRHFIAKLMRDTVIETLLTWTDEDCPQPEQMSPLIQNILSTILNTSVAKR